MYLRDMGLCTELGWSSGHSEGVQEIKPHTIICPQQVYGGNPLEGPSMREEECARRLLNNKHCRNECTVVDHLREKLNIPRPVKKIRERTIKDPIPCIYCGATLSKAVAENFFFRANVYCCQPCYIIKHRIPELKQRVQDRKTQRLMWESLSKLKRYHYKRTDVQRYLETV